MKIHDQIIEILTGKEGSLVHSKDLENELFKKFRTNGKSIMISDRCYNRYNASLKNDFSKRIHLFEYIKDGEYKYLGRGYKYTGKVFHKPQEPKDNKKEFVVGEWKDGKLLMNDKQINEIRLNNNKTKNVKKNSEEPKIKLENYQPKKAVDLERLDNYIKEIDYIEIHRKLIEIGKLAEKIVLDDEFEFLKHDYSELAEKVRLVSNDPKLGFDVLSFETDGEQKQIEVKAISVNNNIKSFIITQNEFSKSKEYTNYYVYCVTDINTANPNILRIKNPDFNSNNFTLEPLTYKVTFK